MEAMPALRIAAAVPSDRSFDPVRLIIRCLTAIVPRVAGRFDAGKAALRK
ncbi:hypothetical protein [Burkholderia sp. Se-20378]|nr:hypothetical protein [Burkholderia sp. Se-20378]MBN3768285.1 hypothetical protein [Burkholderia sp. Se-20378]